MRATNCGVTMATFTENVAQNWSEEFFEFDQLSVKMKAEYKDGADNQNFTINAVMIKDSLIWASISALGIEGIRILVDKDSIKLINRLKKTYYVHSTDFLEQFLGQPFGVSQLQQLLLGNPIFDFENLKYSENDFYGEHFSSQAGMARYIVQLNECLRINRFVLKEAGSERKLDSEYSNFMKVKKHGILPTIMNLHVKDERKDVYFKLQYVSVNTDEINAIPFRIPSRYARGM